MSKKKKKSSFEKKIDKLIAVNKMVLILAADIYDLVNHVQEKEECSCNCKNASEDCCKKECEKNQNEDNENNI